jgi:hypothetical protein
MVCNVVVVILYMITVKGLIEEWFILLLLYVQDYSLRFDRGLVHVVVVGNIVYYYCLMFDSGVVHVVGVILSTITVLGLTEEWVMLWFLYCLQLLFNVEQKAGSCCCCYVVYHYSLRFDRGVVHVVVVGYIVYHYCLMFDRGVVHFVVVICLPLQFNV